MILRILICLILLIIGHMMFAQERPETGEAPYEKTRRSNHYLGIQANQLLRQVLNFGGNANVGNPYLLTYSVNSKTNGAGFTAAIGYNYSETKTSDGFTSVISKNGDFALRFGLEGKHYLSRRWLSSISGDILIESAKVKTESSSGGGGSSNATVETKLNRSGFGPRATLSYQFHDRLLIGTEAAYYFRFINQKQTTTNTGMPTDPGTKLKSFAFTLPTAIFLVMKF